MKTPLRAVAWSLSALVGGAALLAVACSTTADPIDSGTPEPQPSAPPGPVPVPPKDAGAPPRADASPSFDAAPGVDAARDGATADASPGEGGLPGEGGVPGDGGLLGDAGAPDCGVPPRLRSPDAGAAGTVFFCPFEVSGTPYCTGDQTCCSGTGSGATGFDTTMCVPGKVACAAGSRGPRSRWECASPANCPGATATCCIGGTDGGPPAVDTEKVAGLLCPAEFQRGFFIGGTVCRSACGAGELTVCSRDADCTFPKKCVAFATNSRDLGYCK